MFNCPEIHYVPRKDFIIKRYLFSQPILKRDSNIVHRRIEKRDNALKILNTLQQKMMLIDSLATKKDLEDNPNSKEEFSESDLNEIQDSPTSSILKKRINTSKDIPNPLSLKPLTITEESIQKTGEEENVDEYVSKIRKKETFTNICMPNVKPRGSNQATFKQMPSFDTQTQPKQFLNNWNHHFERMHVFSQYFVENNSDVVLKKYELQIMKKIARIQKLKQIKRRKTMLMSQFSQRRTGISPVKKKQEEKSSNFETSEAKRIHP